MKDNVICTSGEIGLEYFTGHFGCSMLVAEILTIIIEYANLTDNRLKVVTDIGILIPEACPINLFLCYFVRTYEFSLIRICRFYFYLFSFVRLKPTIDEIIPIGQGLLGIFFLWLFTIL